MRDCCPANQFDGACEDGKCKSYSSRLAEINRKISTVQAKRRADRMLLTFIAFLCIGTAGFLLCNALVKLDKTYELAGRV